MADIFLHFLFIFLLHHYLYKATHLYQNLSCYCSFFKFVNNSISYNAHLMKIDPQHCLQSFTHISLPLLEYKHSWKGLCGIKSCTTVVWFLETDVSKESEMRSAITCMVDMSPSQWKSTTECNSNLFILIWDYGTFWSVTEINFNQHVYELNRITSITQQF
jgi:hypothetical protein